MRDPGPGPTTDEQQWTGPQLLAHVTCPCCGLPQPLTAFAEQLDIKAQLRETVILTCDKCNQTFQVMRMERMLAVWTKPGGS